MWSTAIAFIRHETTLRPVYGLVLHLHEIRHQISCDGDLLSINSTCLRHDGFSYWLYQGPARVAIKQERELIWCSFLLRLDLNGEEIPTLYLDDRAVST